MASTVAATATTAAVAAAGTGALQVSLHPLVLLTISDHYTRTRLDAESSVPAAAAAQNVRIVGIILGTQNGREVEVCNCFEMIVKQDAGLVQSYDAETLSKRLDQFKKVYLDYELLGWYTNGTAPHATDLAIHKQIAAINENALLLQIDNAAAYRTSTKDLPLTIYETKVTMSAAGQADISLVPVSYRIASVEAERIGVDHVAHTTPGGSSQLTAHLMGMYGTIKMLNIRVKSLQRYVAAARKGEVPYDHVIMREVNSLCYLLPAIDTAEFRDRLASEASDALLVTYLATLTKVSGTANDLVEKYSASFDRAGGRHPHMFFA
jgi:COP9 signalosome complex subunit 6